MGIESNWLNAYELNDKGIFVKYLNSVYYSFITMSTIGYGDITPETNSERIFSIFMILVACSIFGYSMNVIGSIFQEIAQRR